MRASTPSSLIFSENLQGRRFAGQACFVKPQARRGEQEAAPLSSPAHDFSGKPVPTFPDHAYGSPQ
jgi:hypothetical protein